MKIFGIILIFYLYSVEIVLTQLTSDVNRLLNWCIDSQHHKKEPGVESALYGQCTPWKNRACCTSDTTKSLHTESLYNFNYDHCPEKKPLSSACRRHFMQDHCFYQCSPNVGPWAVKETRSWRKERYYKVPLCASECISWYNDCKNDYTCTDNWSVNFDWVNITSEICKDRQICTTNVCPSGSHCHTFEEIYRGPKMFCERVWDHAWEFTLDEEHCMKIWFDEDDKNPNEEVAKWKATAIAGSDTILVPKIVLLVLFATNMLLSRQFCL